MNVKKMLRSLSLGELREVQHEVMGVIHEKQSYEVENLRNQLGYSFMNALLYAGIEDVRTLREMGPSDLLKLDGIGPKKAQELEEKLQELGIYLKQISTTPET